MTVTHEAITLNVVGATDGVDYSFTLDGGGSWSDWQSSSTYTATGLQPDTGYPCSWRVRNAAGKVAHGAQTTITTAAVVDTTAPQWSATFTLGTPTSTQVQATASAQATDDIGVDRYEVSFDGGSTWAPITINGGWVFNLPGEGGTTYAQTQLRAVDATGNASTPLDVPSYTLAPTRTLLAADDFDRADSTAGLGVSSGGQTWEQIGDLPVGIKDGHASCTNGSGTVNFAVVDAGQSDMVVEAISEAVGSWSIAGRVVDADNHYSVMALGGTKPRPYVTIGGASTPLAPDVTIVAGDRVTMRLYDDTGGTRFVFSVNEVQQYSVLVSTAGRPGGTKAGVRFVKGNPAAILDDFTVRDGS